MKGKKSDACIESKPTPGAQVESAADPVCSTPAESKRATMMGTNLCADSPCKLLIVSLLLILLVVVLTGTVGNVHVGKEFDVTQTRDYLDWGSKRVKDQDMITLAKKKYFEHNFGEGDENDQLTVRSQMIDDWTIELYLQCLTCDTLSTVENVLILHKAEEGLLHHELY